MFRGGSEFILGHEWWLTLGSVLCQAPPALSKAKLDLLININGGGAMMLEYMAEIYDGQSMARFAAALVQFLEAATADPGALAAEVSLMSAADKAAVEGFVAGDMRPEYQEAPFTIHAFEAVAAAHPQRVALEFGGEEMSYAEVRMWSGVAPPAAGLWPHKKPPLSQPEQRQPQRHPSEASRLLPLAPPQLNARANTLAHALAADGVGHDCVVGLMLPRSFELVVAILGVLKTGSGYLPLDPDYPDDRLGIYVEDAEVPQLLVIGSLAARGRALTAASPRGVKITSVPEVAAGVKVPDPGNLPKSRVQANGANYAIFTVSGGLCSALRAE